MNVIEIRHLTHIYGQGLPFAATAVEDVSLSVEKGELLGVIGHTGSGKSTLIQHFNGLLKPTSGQVLVNGTDIWENKKATRQARFQVGLCFQYPEYQLFEETVEKDIAFGPKNMGLAEDEIRARVARAAAFAGVRPSLLQKSPFDLSGGEKRRAAIAGMMAMEPAVLVLDEPTAGLDPEGRTAILQMLLRYRDETGRTVVLVSHSMEDIAAYADRAVVMAHGRIVMQGGVGEIFSHADALRGMGLNVPQITQVFLALHARGLPVRTDIYTVEQAKREILKQLGKE